MSVFDEKMLAKRSSLILTDAQMGLLDGITFVQHDLINRATKGMVRKLYAHMISGQHPSWRGKRPCTINVEIFNPINQEQSRKLDHENAKIGWTIRASVGGIVVIATRNKLAGMAASAAAGKYVMSKMRSWDEGDILICLGARVSGGIGQQSRNESFVVKRTAYEESNIVL